MFDSSVKITKTNNAFTGYLCLGGYVLPRVCLSVCLLVCLLVTLRKTIDRIVTKIRKFCQTCGQERTD